MNLNICSVLPVTWLNSAPDLNVIEQSAADRVIAIQCFTWWPWTCATCCARLWDNFHQVWPSTTYPCLNNSVFDADVLCNAVTLTFDILTLNIYSTSSVIRLNSVRKLSEIEQSPAELLIKKEKKKVEINRKIKSPLFLSLIKRVENNHPTAQIKHYIITNLTKIRFAVFYQPLTTTTTTTTT